MNKTDKRCKFQAFIVWQQWHNY